MKVNACNRCGKIIKGNRYEFDITGLTSGNNYIPEPRNLCNKLPGGDEEVHLCNDCMAEFVDFIKKGN